MNSIFLSASIPVPGRGNFAETADPFLIQSAVRELVTLVLGRRLLVWGGHPAITPMVWAVCEDLGVDYASSVILYQSEFFRDIFPEENNHFGNVEYIRAIAEDRAASLHNMRQAMLSRDDLACAVFIGGMEGVIDEHAMFTHAHPTARVLSVPGPGGAARQLSQSLGVTNETDLQDVDFARLFHLGLGIQPTEARNQIISGEHNGKTGLF